MGNENVEMIGGFIKNSVPNRGNVSHVLSQIYERNGNVM